MKTMSPAVTARRYQQGVALIVVLILLLIMTLLGLASLRGTLMEERMSSNLYDRSLSFQSVEAALRRGEAVASTAVASTFPTSGLCNGAGLCPPLVDPAASLLTSGGVTVTLATDANAAGITPPRYIIENMGEAPNWPGCDREIPRAPTCMSARFRITAASSGTERAQVVLQSNYAAP
jgi:type IV pilus assembly protein PilX